jgi:hypothetical protein
MPAHKKITQIAMSYLSESASYSALINNLKSQKIQYYNWSIMSRVEEIASPPEVDG